MSEKNEEIYEDDIEANSAEENEESGEKSERSAPMTEEEFKEEYSQLPMWQHVVLVLLFLFLMAAVIVGIDFVVSFFTELLKKIF